MIRVIIVDDDNLVRLGLRNSLPWARHDMSIVGVFSNGEQTLAFLAGSPADLVLLDLEMPGMTGLELLRRIRGAYPGTDCVILTMHQDFGFVQEALRQGALDYILKVELEPQNFDEVLGRIRRRFSQGRVLGRDLPVAVEAETEAECSQEIRRCIQRAVEIIHAETGVHLNVVDVARRVNMSRSYFSLCFKKVVGKSFNDYFRSVRIEQAKQMLCTTRSSIKWIASACGFSDEKYFSTLFRQYTGCLPREYRGRAMGEQGGRSQG